ncbi:MAG TPA: rhomboid family intramembrane serine protease [Candidatus Nanoarchaeia archaeon]|nr:rhomboid family intramembrane serine protease [Candidatus Nanoarchaeia archaeon]
MKRPARGYFSPSRWSLTGWIIAVTIATSVLFWSAVKFLPALFSYLALTPKSFVSGYFWTAVTSMFLHANVFHLFVNMFSLFFLGKLVERIIGRKRYAWFYLIAGIVGALFFVGGAYLSGFVVNGDRLFGTPITSAVGASGALFGLLGLLAVLIPRQRVYLIVGPLVLIVLQVILGRFIPESLQGVFALVVSFLFIFMIIGMFSSNSVIRKIALPMDLPLWLAPLVAIAPLSIISFFVELPIGNTAHFGGLIAGLVYGAVLRRKYARKVALLNRMFKR